MKNIQKLNATHMTEYGQQVELMIRLLRKSEDEKQIR